MVVVRCCKTFEFEDNVGNDLAGKPCRVLADLLCFPGDIYSKTATKSQISVGLLFFCENIASQS